MRTVQNNWPWIIGLTAIGLWSFTTHYQKTERQQLGHLVMQVSDLERSQRFYEDVLHMETKEEVNYDNRQIEIYWDIRDEPFGKRQFQGNQTPLPARKLMNMR